MSNPLVDVVLNERGKHKSFSTAVRHLRSIVEHTAIVLAKQNAAWHDDPNAEDHAAYHTPWDEQFPEAVRHEAILALVKHYLEEGD